MGTRFLLAHLLRDAAQRRPEAAALRDRGRQVSWSELRRRALSLARALRERGLQRGERVALYCDKSHEAVSAIYGVLCAGGAYVPIDAHAPAARVAAVLHDSGARHVVTDARGLAELARALPGSPVECLWGVEGPQAPLPAVGWDEAFGGPSPEADGACTELDPAYVLYTSGSTGRPKGILHTQRSALAFVEWACGHFAPGPDERFSAHAPLQFDLSIFDLFVSAAAAGCTVLVPEGVAKLPASLAQLMQDERLTFWYSVPFALVQLLERGGLARRDLSSLRCVIFAGEPLPPACAPALRRAFPRARLSNLYGPTETNVCTWFDLPDEPWPADRPLPIGRACANTETLALDEGGRPAGPGATGELLVRGPTVMAGYWAAPARTEAAFLPAPTAIPYERPFYRTGDQVRVRADGGYDFLGRRDRQVKLRGYRLELDEIEHALGAHPELAEAAVYLVNDARGERLEAAAAPRPGARPSAGALLAHLAARLPPQAVPAEVRVWPALPRTATGKVDRQALARGAAAELELGTGAGGSRDGI